MFVGDFVIRGICLSLSALLVVCLLVCLDVYTSMHLTGKPGNVREFNSC